MNEADNMFEELEYEKFGEDTDWLIEYIKNFSFKRPRHIIFSTLDKKICVCEENEKEFAIKKDYFSMDELKAINKKCEELGWI